MFISFSSSQHGARGPGYQDNPVLKLQIPSSSHVCRLLNGGYRKSESKRLRHAFSFFLFVLSFFKMISLENYRVSYTEKEKKYFVSDLLVNYFENSLMIES